VIEVRSMNTPDLAGVAVSSIHEDSPDFAIAELCDVIDQMVTYIGRRVGTQDEQPGEAEAEARALDVLRRYKPAS
jgi:hypothetical protein